MPDLEQSDGPLPGAAPVLAQMLTLLSGSFASGFDVAAASLEINRRQERWLNARAIDDPEVRATLEERSAQASAQANSLLTALARASAAPVAKEDSVLINGRVVDNGDGREGLAVVALDTRGHALGQATTSAGGVYSISLDAPHEVVLMITDPNGKRLHVDERVIDAKLGGTAFRELDLAAAKGAPRREKADLSDRATVPDVAGMDITGAGAVLRENGFTNIGVSFVPRPGSDGVAVGTDPQTGNLVEYSSKIELAVGKDPTARFDRKLVASAVKVDTGKAVPDEAVDKMFEALAKKGITGFDKLAAAAEGDDKAFAQLAKLSPRHATKARQSLLKTMTGLQALRVTKG